MTQSERARASHNAAGADRQRRGIANEKRVAAAIPGAQQLRDNEPFDVKGKGVAVEVKTICKGAKQQKIYMKGDQIARKKRVARREKLHMHTVVFHEDSGQWYHRKGVGTMHLSTMTPVSYGQLSELVR